MNPGQWEQAARSVLSGLDGSHLYRRRRLIVPLGTTHVQWQGRRYVNFASNNYLGLAQDPRVIRAAAETLARDGAGSAASPLISGYGPAHADAERHIANWKGTEACVLLPSGYQANHAAIQTLAAVALACGKSVRFLLDKLCHASLIDAVRASGAPFRVFPHNHMGKLGRFLDESPPGELQAVVTESIFSMDGDPVDLPAIARLKQKHPFLLLLDEAHASGVYGPCGSGLAAELGLADAADVTVVTLSKAIGSAGGAVCAPATFCEALVNLARAYVYSTSVAPAAAAAADTAISIMESEPQRQQRVRQLARQTREELLRSGHTIPAGDSPIIPLILGSETAALEAADYLMTRGVFVLAIRPPTVPRGSSRLRITLSSQHTDAEIESLIRMIGELKTRAAG